MESVDIINNLMVIKKFNLFHLIKWNVKIKHSNKNNIYNNLRFLNKEEYNYINLKVKINHIIKI
jgi:hypothetical protein